MAAHRIRRIRRRFTPQRPKSTGRFTEARLAALEAAVIDISIRLATLEKEVERDRKVLLGEVSLDRGDWAD